MAGISGKSFDSLYEDLLELLNLNRDDDEPVQEVDVKNDSLDDLYTSPDQSYTTPVNTDTETYLDDSTLPGSDVIPEGVIDPDQGGINNPDSPVLTTPEPCSIILSSLGLGILGYLKRRRAI